MLGFFDESGDPGLKTDSGSSLYFVVALVTFSDNEEALRCDRRIDTLRGELRLPHSYEFHFSVNSKGVREAFLRAVQAIDFRYHIFVVDKTPMVLNQTPFNSSGSLYRYAAVSLFENAGPYLEELSVVMDKGSNREFRAGLFRDLRNSTNPNSGRQLIKRMKQQDSRRNNLLQLVDYVASIINQAMSGKSDSQEMLKRYLERREVTRGIWPE